MNGVYLIEELVREVRIILDSNTSTSALIQKGDTITLSIDEIIRSRLLTAITWAVREAPYYRLGSGKPFGGSIWWHRGEVGIGSGELLLPADFLRLVSFKISDWSRAATTPISDDDPRYHLQHSRFEGIRGSWERPVVAITQRAGGLVLEFYSCNEGESVYIEEAQYIPRPQINDNSVVLSSHLKDAVLYYTAYLVSTTLSEYNGATAFFNLAKEHLQ